MLFDLRASTLARMVDKLSSPFYHLFFVTEIFTIVTYHLCICRMFSLQSDIWSYGVVLWELFSLARSPYPGLEPNEEFIRRLEAGHRMEKPSHATDEL